MNSCSVEGCAKLGRLRRGYCDLHYARWLSHGNPNTVKARVVRNISDLEERTTKTELGCWEWTGATNTSGYAWMFFNGRSRIGSRVAWEFANGAIPDGALVLHRCDNRRCINPGHLFLGDNAANQQDMIAKGRGNKAFGSRSGVAKLNDVIVRSLREGYASGVSVDQLANRHGVNRSTAYGAIMRRTWRHV